MRCGRWRDATILEQLVQPLLILIILIGVVGLLHAALTTLLIHGLDDVVGFW